MVWVAVVVMALLIINPWGEVLEEISIGVALFHVLGDRVQLVPINLQCSSLVMEWVVIRC